MARLRAEDAEKRAASGHGPDFLEAFARGLRGIGAFGREKKYMTLSDVARATGLPKPSVRRALYTLTCLGLAASDGRTFRLTPRIMELASAYLGSNMVSTVVQPACERIGDRTEQSCFAAVLDGYDIVMIAHSMHVRPDVLAPTIGIRRPAFNTAAGRAILSQLGDKALDAWLETKDRENPSPLLMVSGFGVRYEGDVAVLMLHSDAVSLDLRIVRGGGQLYAESIELRPE